MGAAQWSNSAAWFPVFFLELGDALDGAAAEGRLLLDKWEENPMLSMVDALEGDQSALAGSLLKVRSPAIAVAYGAWVAIMPGAALTADCIPLTLFATEGVQSGVVNISSAIMADMVESVALGVLSDEIVLGETPAFSSHAAVAAPRLFAARTPLAPAYLVFRAPYAHGQSGLARKAYPPRWRGWRRFWHSSQCPSS